MQKNDKMQATKNMNSLKATNLNIKIFDLQKLDIFVDNYSYVNIQKIFTNIFRTKCHSKLCPDRY
jgi:hypothetical protein